MTHPNRTSGIRPIVSGQVAITPLEPHPFEDARKHAAPAEDIDEFDNPDREPGDIGVATAETRGRG